MKEQPRALIFSASAGSGKTYNLAYKFVHDTIKHFPSKPYLYRAILAVTFTNKATEEMKRRILNEINDLIEHPTTCNYMKGLKEDLGLSQEQIMERAKAIRSRILHDYSHFTILTIDKFFQRILRAFIKELGIDLNYNIELDTDSLLSRSTDSLIEDIPHNEELQRWIMEFAQERIDQNKSWDLRSGIISLGGDIFKESNKLTIEQAPSKQALREAIAEAEKVAAAARAKARAIAQQAVEKMDKAGLTGDEFQYRAGGFISTFRRVAAGEEPSLGTRVRDKAQSPDSWSKISSAQALAPELQPLLRQIVEIYDNHTKLFSTLRIIKANYRSYALLQDIHNKVTEMCKDDGVMLLSETKHFLSRFIEGNDAPFIYEKTGNRFERFMIDEFQDTSQKEWANFIPLLRNAIAEAEDTAVLIVGDIKQSIYRWRGGDWRILQRGVQSALGSEHTHTKFKKENYRSLRQIVKFNNDAIGRITEADNKALNAMLLSALDEQQISRATYDELYDSIHDAYISYNQDAMRQSTKDGYVRVELFDKDEEPPIVEYIESAIARGYAYKDILILCRSKSEGARAAKILLDYKQRNNTFNIMTQDSLIVGNASISNFIIASLRLTQDRDDSISLAIYNDYLSQPYDQPLSQEQNAWLTSISQLSPEQAFEHIVKRHSLETHRDEIAYLQAIHEQIVQFCSSKVADINLFLQAWDDGGKDAALSVEMNDSTIELLTIHKAKGLEKKVVIIPYCSWSLDPMTNSHIWATPDNQNDMLASLGRFPVNYTEEMRAAIFADEYYREKVYSHVDAINLLYVALTRAGEELYICIPQGPRMRKQNVGTLLWDAISGEKSQTLSVLEYGEQSAPAKSSEQTSSSQNILLDEYPTSTQAMNLRLQDQRYFEEDGQRHLSARNIGIQMHSILSQATSAEEVKEGIDHLLKQGRISSTQAEELRSTIDREFARPEVREWFGEWDDVRCENDILCSDVTGTRRPDRVMIRGQRAVVVDYKFGEEHAPQHSLQVKQYISLLHEMGYRDIEGYLWYLSTGKIVKIEN